MDYYFLDRVPWEDSQSLYHAAAYLGRETLFILRPATPYVCLGYHQDAQAEIDLDYCDENGIPVIRREVGGGAVYLDGGQLFYQLIMKKERPGLPLDKAALYRRLLEPVVATYRQFGVPAEFRPVNDILAGSRKISGNGAAEIEGMVVFVGNFILDFDYETMARVLKVADEKFRDKIYKTLAENLTTLRRETGQVPVTANLASELAGRYASLLGELQSRSEIDPDLRQAAEAWFSKADTREWLFENDRRGSPDRPIKIREGVYALERVVKLPGGLVRATAVLKDGRIFDVHLSGDFFIYPRDAVAALENELEGALLDPEGLSAQVEAFFRRHSIEAPGISPAELAGIFAGQ